MIIPKNEYLLIKVLKNENEGKGILLPDTLQKEEFGVGEVMALAETIEDIKVGDKVVFDKLMLVNAKIEEEEIKFLKYSDILGVVKNE